MLERLKKYAEENGTSIGRIEANCGFSKGYLTKIDDLNPSAYVIKKLSQETGIPILELMELIPDKKHGSA